MTFPSWGFSFAVSGMMIPRWFFFFRDSFENNPILQRPDFHFLPPFKIKLKLLKFKRFARSKAHGQTNRPTA
jgi:hypothetical protein